MTTYKLPPTLQCLAKLQGNMTALTAFNVFMQMRVSWMKRDPEQRFTLKNKTFTDYISAGFPKSAFQVKDQLQPGDKWSFLWYLKIIPKQFLFIFKKQSKWRVLWLDYS